MAGYDQFGVLDRKIPTEYHEGLLQDDKAAKCLKFLFKIITVPLYNCELTG